MSGLPGFPNFFARRVVRADYLINGRPMTDEEIKHFNAQWDKFDRRMREAFKDMGRG